MTKKLLICLVVFGVLAVPAFAQKAEVFGGYQYTRLDGGWNGNGWNAAVTGNLNHWFGVTGDFSGAYKSGLSLTTYTFGPVISHKEGPINPFAHVLLGGGRASAAGVSSNGFNMMAGGGLDWGTSSHGLAVRLFQLDWMMTRFSGVTDKNNMRLSTGVVVRF